MKTLPQVVDAAVAEGVLPSDAAGALQEPSNAQPWPVVVLGFIGAQFAVWPIFAFLLMIGEGVMLKGAGPYITGALLMALGCTLLRGKGGAGFLSHIAFTAVLTGNALFCYGLVRDLDGPNSITVPALLACALQIGLALVIRLRWAQVLLGALALLAFVVAGSHSGRGQLAFGLAWWVLLAAAGLWAAAVLARPRWSTLPLAPALDSLALGWCVALLLSLLGNTGFSLGVVAGLNSNNGGHLRLSSFAVLAAIITLASGLFLWRRWRLHSGLSGAAQSLLALAFVSLAVFSLFSISIAVVAVICAAALLSGHTRLFALALVVLASQLSGFYYSLNWTLVDKALLLMATGAALIIGMFIISKFSNSASQNAGNARAEGAKPETALKQPLVLVLAGACLVFAAINWNIVQKERVISQGQRLFVELAPRDPRSLMQGDYMALTFALPTDVRMQLGGGRQGGDGYDVPLPLGRRATVVAGVDARGVAKVLRVASRDGTLASGEVLLPVQFKSGSWALVTDAFFFPEGKGQSLEAARYGELRALGNGQALLVGLTDDKLVTIKPVADKARGNGPQVQENP